MSKFYKELFVDLGILFGALYFTKRKINKQKKISKTIQKMKRAEKGEPPESLESLEKFLEEFLNISLEEYNMLSRIQRQELIDNKILEIMIENPAEK